MKKFGLLILSAVLGSALTIGSFSLFNLNGKEPVRIQYVNGTPVVGAAYTINNEGEIITLEFTDVAAKVMPAVVHIKSTQLNRVSGNQYRSVPDPFRDFFDDDMLRRFFGPDLNAPKQQQRAR